MKFKKQGVSEYQTRQHLKVLKLYRIVRASLPVGRILLGLRIGYIKSLKLMDRMLYTTPKSHSFKIKLNHSLSPPKQDIRPRNASTTALKAYPSKPPVNKTTKNHSHSSSISIFPSQKLPSINNGRSLSSTQKPLARQKSFQITSQPKTPKIAYTLRTKKGSSRLKSDNQDSSICIPKFLDSLSHSLFAVMDGHGRKGSLISQFIKSNFPVALERSFSHSSNFHTVIDQAEPLQSSSISLITRSFKQASLNINERLCSSVNCQFSGSTCVSVLLKGSHCFCSNLGDSEAYIGNKRLQWRAIPLSTSHKPDHQEQKQRIERSGGCVKPMKDANGNYAGPCRVWLRNRKMPGLAMSRSFGDTVAQSVGVISEPDVRCVKLGFDDKFIILASDGVWDVMRPESVVELISENWENGSLETAADALMDRAALLWKESKQSMDDITFIIIFLCYQDFKEKIWASLSLKSVVYQYNELFDHSINGQVSKKSLHMQYIQIYKKAFFISKKSSRFKVNMAFWGKFITHADLSQVCYVFHHQIRYSA